jgi:hypothetical protein
MTTRFTPHILVVYRRSRLRLQRQSHLRHEMGYQTLGSFENHNIKQCRLPLTFPMYA